MHLRRERVCLIESCRAAQSGCTPLHLAVMCAKKGHASVVEQLLVAGADTEAKDVVSGERARGCQMQM